MVRQIDSQMNDMKNEFQRQMHALQELIREFLVTTKVEETSQNSTSNVSTELMHQNSDQQTSDQSESSR